MSADLSRDLILAGIAFAVLGFTAVTIILVVLGLVGAAAAFYLAGRVS